jgi:large subunit ribosomal protein L21
MYSVVEIKGHQYKLSAGDLIDVEKIDAEVGATVSFNKVLLIGGKRQSLVLQLLTAQLLQRKL